MREADLTGAILRRTKLDGAYLLQASLTGIDATEASLVGAILIEADLRPSLEQTTDFAGANLSGGRPQLCLPQQRLFPVHQLFLTPVSVAPKVSLRSRPGCVQADFTGANLQGADLSYADLTGIILRQANLTGADLTGVSMEKADLTGATMPDGSIHD